MLTNRSIPACTVIPEIPYSNLDAAIHWLCDVFGFTVRLRIANHRAQLNVGQGAIVVTDPGGAEGRTRCSVMVRVDDVDHHHAHAMQRGARVVGAPASYPYGERQYSIEDLEGHCWTFTQSIADVDPVEWGGTPGKP